MQLSLFTLYRRRTGEVVASKEPECPAKVVPATVNKKGPRSNLNRTPLRSRIPQAVSTPITQRPTTTTTTTSPPTTKTGVVGRIGRPVANKTSGIVAPKVVKTVTAVTAAPVRQHNNGTSSGSRLATSRTTTTATPTTSHQRTSGENKPGATSTASSSSSNLLKSVKPGLTPVSTTQQTTLGSKIPRPSSGAQPKSSPPAQSARPLTAASSAPHRHPSSSSLLPRTAAAAAPMAGVKPSSSPLHKSTSRLQLTHNKGESSLRSDLVSAH